MVEAASGKRTIPGWRITDLGDDVIDEGRDLGGRLAPGGMQQMDVASSPRDFPFVVFQYGDE